MASPQTENQPLFHTQSLEQTLKSLQTDEKRGLSATEVAARLQKYGHNELPKPEGESIWEKIKEQFEDLLVRILCLAAVISFLVSLTGKRFVLQVFSLQKNRSYCFKNFFSRVGESNVS